MSAEFPKDDFSRLPTDKELHTLVPFSENDGKVNLPNIAPDTFSFVNSLKQEVFSITINNRDHMEVNVGHGFTLSEAAKAFLDAIHQVTNRNFRDLPLNRALTKMHQGMAIGRAAWPSLGMLGYSFLGIVDNEIHTWIVDNINVTPHDYTLVKMQHVSLTVEDIQANDWFAVTQESLVQRTRK